MPDDSQLKQGYELLPDFSEKQQRATFETLLRQKMQAGNIDVNIMTKIDKMNVDSNGEPMGNINTDALAALRGFAESDLCSAVVLSAGINQRLYSYLETFVDFYPHAGGILKKKIILKVSDYRSACIQGKILAKKGLWVSEFRIESGLNCGGHAFATDGLLLGPILEEFKQKRTILLSELFEVYQDALTSREIFIENVPGQRISVQGGIGTAEEQSFLLKYYGLNATGWGSPFLLVPEATNVDDITLQHLAQAHPDDYYLSDASPMGVPFNNFRNSSIEHQRLERIAAGRPGSPCTKKLLISNTEFTVEPICTASRKYQSLKIKQLQASALSKDELERQVQAVTEKICLCDGLCNSAYLKNDMLGPRENKAVAICPGPNLAYFSRIFTLNEMIGHIYGKNDLLQHTERPHLFINELKLYVTYLNKLFEILTGNQEEKHKRYLQKFKSQLLDGIGYYKQLFSGLMVGCDMMTELAFAEREINKLSC